MTNFDPKRNVRMIPCSCPDMGHHIVVERHDWTDIYPSDPIEYSVHVTLDRRFGFWKRLVLAFQYLFRIENDGYYYHDVLLSEEQFKEISHLFDGVDDEKDRKSKKET